MCHEIPFAYTSLSNKISGRWKKQIQFSWAPMLLTRIRLERVQHEPCQAAARRMVWGPQEPESEEERGRGLITPGSLKTEGPFKALLSRTAQVEMGGEWREPGREAVKHSDLGHGSWSPTDSRSSPPCGPGQVMQSF